MNKLFLPITFFVGTVVLLVVYTQGSLKNRSAANTQSSGKVRYMQVHQYKQETAMKMGLRKEQAQFRKNHEAANFGRRVKSRNEFESVDLTPEKNIAAENQYDEQYQQAVTLDQQMDQFLAKRQEYDELATLKKKAYVEQFKAEARDMGYEVKIDSNMQIISVEKIGESDDHRSGNQ